MGRAIKIVGAVNHVQFIGGSTSSANVPPVLIYADSNGHGPQWLEFDNHEFDGWNQGTTFATNVTVNGISVRNCSFSTDDAHVFDGGTYLATSATGGFLTFASTPGVGLSAGQTIYLRRDGQATNSTNAQIVLGRCNVDKLAIWMAPIPTGTPYFDPSASVTVNVLDVAGSVRLSATMTGGQTGHDLTHSFAIPDAEGYPITIPAVAGGNIPPNTVIAGSLRLNPF